MEKEENGESAKKKNSNKMRDEKLAERRSGIKWRKTVGEKISEKKNQI